MVNLTKRCTLLVSLFAFMKTRMSTSIMNDVHIAKGELNPPTVFNRSSSNGNLTKDNGNGGDLFHSDAKIPKGHNEKNVLNINRPPADNNEIIGSSLLDLSGISDIDNIETILGDTVADAFLMNSWDDTEIRYGKLSLMFKLSPEICNIPFPFIGQLVLVYMFHLFFFEYVQFQNLL